MKRRTRVAAVVVAGGLLTGGAVATAAPAIAGAGPFGQQAAGAAWTGAGHGPGAGMGAGGNGVAARDGSCLADVPSGTLTAEQKSTLAAMAEEEKLAGDLYRAFADQYPAAVFDRIAAAEDRHLAAVRTLLDRYGISDPTAGREAGAFTSATVQATYDRLLAQGMTGQSAALGVGQQVERTDIADLQKALDGLDAADVTQVYQHLLAASRQHLTAFTTWAQR